MCERAKAGNTEKAVKEEKKKVTRDGKRETEYKVRGSGREERRKKKR